MTKRDDQQSDAWTVLAHISDFLTIFSALIGLCYPLVAFYRANWAPTLDDILVAILISSSIVCGVLLLRMLVRRQQPPVPEPLSPEAAERARTQMLAKVRATWMQLLDDSLQDVVRIELGLTSAAALVDDPRKRLRQPNRPERMLLPGTPIHAVFDDLAGELLILGAPGAGKTTMLLELTRTLLDRAQHDPAHAIPVVFNLSTWATQHPPIAAWLVDELSKRYDVPRKIGQSWVDAGAILPLLDGLDEVALDQRHDCVEAINAYHSEHGPLRLVVCSRIEEYESLMVHLHLQGAIIIQPLAIDQIDAALEQVGDRLEGVRTAIRDDTVLQDLATTPLLLSIMILAYRDHDSRSLAGFDTLDARRDHLFTAYVERMFEHRGEDPRYPRAWTLHWLAWLARGMVRHSQTIFYIEHLQFDWLPRRQQQKVVDPLLYHQLFNDPITRMTTSWAVRERQADRMLSGILLPITVVEQLRWSWDDALSAVQRDRRTIFLYALGGALFYALVGILSGGLFGALVGALGGGLFGALVEVLGLMIGYGLSVTEIPLKTTPNQGIYRSRRNGLIGGLGAALISWLIVGVGVGLLFGLLGGLDFGLKGGLGFGSLSGVYSAMDGWLLFGGHAYLQHLQLRTLLSNDDLGPSDYAAFLDSCADRILLRKVGGGYIFIHRMLMDYFAALEHDDAAEAEA